MTGNMRRYDRQMGIEGFGREGQEKLKEAKVFISGAGGLSSVISIYLVVAGVGNIRIVDHDVIELSNLNRQILHWHDDIGRKKTTSAKEKLRRMNKEIKLDAIDEKIDEDNVFELVDDYDLIVDGTDNFDTRYLLNKVALEKNIPLFHGAVHGLNGQVTTINPRNRTACLRCIFPIAPPSGDLPVLGATAGVIGCIQATEVIKYITGNGKLLENRLLLWDGLNSTFNEIQVKRNDRCDSCSDIYLRRMRR